MTNTQRKKTMLEARAILAVAAATDTWKDHGPPSLYGIAKKLDMSREGADKADEIWSRANGADEGPETDERALAMCNSMIGTES